VSDSYRVAHLDDLDRIEVAGGQYRPIRRRLGVRAFGINAYTADKAGETVDAPAGTMVFVPDVDARRGAVATADGTTVLVVGGPADSPIPTSPFEYWFAAEAPYNAGDYDRAIEVASEGLAEWPESGQLNYQLACFHALAGRRERALEHLAIAAANDPQVAGWAADDSDLDPIRDDPSFLQPE